ncbi:hypothetical protein [Frigidibacter sp. ROC022]|uniref:hypothetical protein n=1 Tax=Frigidibacter sp. ROC022 TaxID=2971796 RepID=UPI00215A3D53|nr:hypothetical protein [Frigidibacter sp. ROC022]MCR8725621.1 hypothetical protein [Frigidibacter sp. ROC022]
MQRFRRHIHRERRRIGLFVLFVTLAAFLIFSDEIGMEFGIRHAALAAIGTGVGAGLVALGLLMITPGWRHSLETVAISTLLYAMLIVQVPNVSFHDQTHSLAAFVAFLVAAAAIHLLMYGRWSDRILRLPTHVERATCHTGLSRKALWTAAKPDPDHPDSYWDPTVEEIHPVEGDDQALILFHRFPNGMMMEQLIRFDQVNPGKSFRYSYEILGAQERGKQTMAMVLEKRATGIALHLRWERSGYPLRMALMHWIDDWGGRTVDRQLERLEAAQATPADAGGALAEA